MSRERIYLGEQNGWLEYDLYYITKKDQLPQVEEWLDNQKSFLLDTETSGLDPFEDSVATIQIGNPLLDTPTVFVIDVRAFNKFELQPILDRIASDKKVKLGQNIKFEYKFLRTNFGIAIQNLMDTQVTEILLRAGLFTDVGDSYRKSSMDSLCKRYLGISIDKGRDVRTSFYSTPVGCHNQRQLAYAAGDCIYPAYIFAAQKKELVARGLIDCLQIENRFVPVLGDAEITGFGIDPAKWRSLYQESLVHHKEAELELHKLLRGIGQTELFVDRTDDPVLYPKTGKALNFGSGEQVKWAIVQYCTAVKWPIKIVTTETELVKLRQEFGANSRGSEDHKIPLKEYCILTDTEAKTLKLARATKQLPLPLVNALLKHSKYRNPVTTFGLDFLNNNVKKDGRIHTEFHQLSTDTGRMSSTPNLQNVPRDKRYRECFVPREGYKFVMADFSQIEPRITAQVSQDPVYLNTFRLDADIYLAVGEKLFSQKIDKKTDQGAILRQIAKVIVLALAYRMGWYKLWKEIVLALSDLIIDGKVDLPTYQYVQGLHTQFLEQFSKLVEYQNECSTVSNPIATTRDRIWDRMIEAPVTWVEAPCGRKRFFPPTAKSTYTEGSNAPIQGHSATIMKASAVLVNEYIRSSKLDAHIVNFIHDEIIVEVADKDAEVLAPKVKELMETAGKFWLTDVPVKAAFPEGTNGVVDCWTK